MNVGPGKCEFHREGLEAGDPGEGLVLQLKSQGSLEAEFFLPQGILMFLLRPSTD